MVYIPCASNNFSIPGEVIIHHAAGIEAGNRRNARLVAESPALLFVREELDDGDGAVEGLGNGENGQHLSIVPWSVGPQNHQPQRVIVIVALFLHRLVSGAG